MTLKTTKLRDAITFALVVSTTALAGTGVAFAQDSGKKDSDKKETKDLDRVTVVGSRIRVAASEEGTAPVLTIDRAAIEGTGLTSVGDVLFNITASDGGALRNITTSTNGSDGTQNISLRGLGAGRTLLLINGRRWVTRGGGVVDLNTIPISVVERIEVLKDGASAIYGSDAIAGVVNVITRKNFDGAEANVYFGEYSKGDGFQQSYDFTVGANSDRWNTVLSIAYQDQQPVYAGDRERTNVPIYRGGTIESGGAYGSGSTPQGRFRGTGLPGGGNQTLIDGRSGRTAADFRPWRSFTTNNSGVSDRYNFAPVNYLLQPIQRFSIYGQSSLTLTDSINANLQAVYVKRDSNQQLAQVPATLDTTGANGPQWNFAPTATNVFNPFGRDLTGTFIRMVAVGPRKPYYDNDNTAITGSLDGSFELGGKAMYWDAGYSYLNSRTSTRGENYINLFNLRRAVGPSFRDGSGQLRCGTPTAIIQGCVPFNVFGGPDLGLGAGVISRAEYEAMIRYVSYTKNEFAENTTKDYFANLSGEIVELPAGPLGFAFGLETRKDVFLNQPDALVAGGGSSDNFTLPTKGQSSVDEAYVEFNVPILADIPGFKLLELNLASRNSSYNVNGVEARVNQITGAQVINNRSSSYSNTSSKFGLKWQVFDDLLLRGTYSESFRAPNIVELYTGEGESFPPATDPCSSRNGGYNAQTPAAQTVCRTLFGVPVGGSVQPNAQIRGLVGGNADLKPESGKTKSVGIVYSPSYVQGLNFTLDWYQIDLKNVIATRSSNVILRNCLASGNATSQFCQLVTRAANGDLIVVNSKPFNLDKGKVNGYDFQVSYAMPETAWGKFSFQWDNTYQSDNTLFGTVGTYNGSPTFRLRSNITTTWQKGDWDATWAMRYYSALDEDCSAYANAFEYGLTTRELCNHDVKDANGNFLRSENRIPSRLYHDVQVGWKTPWNGKVTAGARNLFGIDPPIVRNSFAQSFDAAYDLPGGGFFYLTYNQKF